MDNSKIKTTDIGKLMVKIDADTKILIRRLEVIKSGIEFIIDGLTKIENCLLYTSFTSRQKEKYLTD